jgi:hypothetical protein
MEPYRILKYSAIKISKIQYTLGRKQSFTPSALSFLGLFIPSIAQVMEALARAADPQSVGLGKKNSCR